MSILFALLGTLWWISIWGLFEIATKRFTEQEKLKTYIVIIGIAIVIVCFFPKILRYF
jgi:hypothetical protein